MNKFDQLSQDLAEKGYAVLENVLTPDEVSENEALFRMWISSIPDHDEQRPSLCPHGIYRYHQAGHQEHAWSIRTHPEVQAPFRHIWRTDELNCSFDGCCYIPAGLTKRDPTSPHVVQAQTQPGFQCVQGLVSLTTNRRTTLVVYEGTHRTHEETEAPDLRALEGQKRVLSVPAGAMALWDSRTLHRYQYGTAEGPTEERIVQYVSYMPKSHPRNTPAIQRKRRAYYAELRTTSHLCSPLRVNPLQGRGSCAINYNKLRPPELDRFDREIRKLI